MTRTDFASPTCSVEIYPVNGNNPTFVFQGDRIRSLTTAKDTGQDSGHFSMTLAPGMPGNPNASWAAVITPMSLVIIGLQRAGRANIVMVGVVRNVKESVDWTSHGVQRAVTISGDDMSYYFTSYNYFAMGLLGSTAGSVIGESLGIGAVSSAQLLNSGFLTGTPQQIGLNFIEQVMFGSNIGLLQNTKVNYKGTEIKLGNIFGTVFEEYPGSNVLFDSDYVTNEQSWSAKFQNIFPEPWYEFFITTAPLGYYGQYTDQPFGYSFGLQSMPQAANVRATVVARINPNPVLEVSVPTPGAGGTISGVNQTAWNSLTVFQPDEMSPRHSDINFEIGDTCNYFAINPTAIGAMFGAGNAQSNTILLTEETAIDVSSIIDFSYRPAVLPTVWFGDSAGNISQNADVFDNFEAIAAGLIARIASTYGPLHLMASGTVILPLRPDIMPGQVFQYQPFRDGRDWQFYILGVQHSYVFGGESTTTLRLERGLPAEIYLNSGGASLQSLLQGRMIRSQGGYTVDTSRTGIQFFGPNSNIQALLGEISTGFYAPGKTN